MNRLRILQNKHRQYRAAIFCVGSSFIVLSLLIIGCVQRYDPVLVGNLKSRIVPPATQPASTQPSTQPACVEVQESIPTGPLTLQAAIDLAYARNPALGQVKEEIEVAKGKKIMAFSAFLPQVSGEYGYFMRNKQPGFNVRDLPIEFGLPIGEKQFQTAELQVQWMICDFGRSLSTFEQANLGVEICDLQYQRARESVAYQTTEFYFTVLRAQKFQVIARDAVRQAEAHLKTAKTFFAHGAVDKNDVLRAEVQAAETRGNAGFGRQCVSCGDGGPEPGNGHQRQLPDAGGGYSTATDVHRHDTGGSAAGGRVPEGIQHRAEGRAGRPIR